MKHVSFTGRARRHQPGYALFCLFVGALLALLDPARGVAQITWTNHSSPVLSPAPGWESSWVQFVAVIDQDSQYVMWYSGATNTAGANVSVGRATSPDGLNWTKDTLNPVMQHSSSVWDGKAAWIPKVLKIGNSYTMWFTGANSSDVWQIGRATSTDGRVWVQDSTNPVIRVGAPGQWDAALVHTGSVLFDGTTYRMWYTGMSQGYGSGGAGIGLATSADGIHWVKDTLHNPVLAAGSAGAWDQHGVGECSVVYDSASQRYLMFYDGNELDYFLQGTSGIGYASSTDGIHWTKYAGNPVLPNNLPGSWTTVANAPFVLLRGSTFHMWYSGGSAVGAVGYATSPRVLSTPTAGLQLWLRADKGVDTLNGTVSKWHDQSGNGNDAIQASASRQPRLVADNLNHKPVVSFDGVNDKLGFTGSTPMTQFSLFVVLNNHVGTPGNDGKVITFGANGDFNHQWFMIMRYPNTPDSIALGPAYGSYVDAFSHNLAAYDQWKNLTIVTTGSVFNTTLRQDGIAAQIFPMGVDEAISVPLGDVTGSGGGIGGADGVPAGTLLAKCDVAEILVYNVALSNSARDSVESYLATKYGLPQPSNSVGREGGSLPEKYALEQNYPNPFNPTTVVSFQLPEASNVRLVVYDILGREVSVLVNERKAAGSYSVRFNAHGMSSGVYLYRLQAGDFVQTRKLLLLR